MKVIGHVGYDAVIKTVNGTEFLDFSVAINEDYTKHDGTKVESTQWVQCSTKNLKLAPYIKKGDAIYVEGVFKIRVYQDKQGQHQAGINLRAFHIQLMNYKKDEEQEQGMAWLTNLIQKEVQKQASK